MMHIVLLEPEIPQNTGNIARTCAATGTELILCGKIGFALEDKYLRRAGMDYYRKASVSVFPAYEGFLEARHPEHMLFATSRAQRGYTEVSYPPDVYLVFGCESRGLPEELVQKEMERCIRIPMAPGIRSLNLAVSAALVLYEALRCQGFPGLD